MKIKDVNWCKVLGGVAWEYYDEGNVKDSAIEGFDTIMKAESINEELAERIEKALNGGGAF